MDYDELFPGRFLKSGEFKGRDVTLVIARVRLEELPQDKGGTRMRGIIGFEGTKKELVLNRTNGESFRAMFGRNVDEWVGKRVTLWPAPYTDNMTGEVGTAIRVRGSPDIAQDMNIEVRLPKKKPMAMTMKKTGKGKTKQAAPPPPVEPEDASGPDSFGATDFPGGDVFGQEAG